MVYPELGWIKVNSDGAVGINEAWSTTAGVLRDANSNWITRYQRFVGRGSALNLELWAILHWLQVM